MEYKESLSEHDMKVMSDRLKNIKELYKNSGLDVKGFDLYL